MTLAGRPALPQPAVRTGTPRTATAAAMHAADATPSRRAVSATIRRSMNEPGEPGGLAEGTLISHLLELRDRLLKAMLAVGICFIPCAIYMNQLFTFVAEPLKRSCRPAPP